MTKFLPGLFALAVFSALAWRGGRASSVEFDGRVALSSDESVVWNRTLLQTQACSCLICDEFVVSRTDYYVFKPSCSSGYYVAVSPNVANTDSKSSFKLYTMDPTNYAKFQSDQSFNYFVAGSSGGDIVTCFDAGSVYSTDRSSSTLYTVVTCENAFGRGDCDLEQDIVYTCTALPTTAPPTGVPTTPTSSPTNIQIPPMNCDITGSGWQTTFQNSNYGVWVETDYFNSDGSYNGNVVVNGASVCSDNYATLSGRYSVTEMSGTYYLAVSITNCVLSKAGCYACNVNALAGTLDFSTDCNSVTLTVSTGDYSGFVYYTAIPRNQGLSTGQIIGISVIVVVVVLIVGGALVYYFKVYKKPSYDALQ